MGHIQTVQKYEEYDLWLKDKHHKALIVEKLDGNVITIADTTVGVSITSRTLQTRKKVAKQQSQPNMENHVSPESTTEQEHTVAEKAQTRGQVKELQKKVQAQTRRYVTRWSLKQMTKEEAEKFRPELREKLRADSSRVNEERTARIAAQKAEIPAETIHSSDVSEKNNENEVFIPDVANLNAMR